MDQLGCERVRWGWHRLEAAIFLRDVVLVLVLLLCGGADWSREAETMVRGGSSGGGQSSLGYLFGSDAGPPKAVAKAPAPEPQAPVEQRPAGLARSNVPEEKAAPVGKADDAGDKGAPKLGRNSNNYHRADGQNTGNFITDRPSTKVHAAPGGGSSLGYLFGGN